MPGALLNTWPELRDRIAVAELGDFPTPVERLSRLEAELGSGPLYVKREDLSSPVYGGNKVRTLEVLFGVAQARGAREICAVGAYGSNHAVATVLHAPRVGLKPGALLFPQPYSRTAMENLVVSSALTEECVALRHWSSVPFAMWGARRAGKFVMAPGGATPEGALGYIGAALELAEQLSANGLPYPREIVLGIGSCCTTAGLLLGSYLAKKLGLWDGPLPIIHAVRVTPWPVTSRMRVLALATATSRLLAELVGRSALRVERRDLAPQLRVDGRELGGGYGIPSARTLAAIELFRQHASLLLDTTYSGKSGAGFLRAAAETPGAPLLFWSTKSSAPLPVIDAATAVRAPAAVQRWLRNGANSAR